VPYITPSTNPDGTICRPVFIPSSSDWLAVVSGALLELTKTYNWEQVDGISVADAVNRSVAMINEYYAGCPGCNTQPGGARIIRIGADGHLEQVSEDGSTWEPATGDYAYPPVPARPDDPPNAMCLASKNAENVLHQVYEQLAHYFAEELTPAQALTALIAWLITTFEIGAGTILFALAAWILPVLGLVWSALEYLTVDLWDENFTKAFTCTLLDCANDTDGVVTFDWDCIEHALYAAAVSFGINEVQLRLYAQINYIIWILGGVDALNTAAATTEITDDDCSFCHPTNWCYLWNFESSDGNWVIQDGGVYVEAVGWESVYVAENVYTCAIYAECPFGCAATANEVRVWVDWSQGLGDPADTFVALYDEVSGGSIALMAPYVQLVDGLHEYVFDTSEYGMFNGLLWHIGSNNDPGGFVTVKSVQASGDAPTPVFGGGASCL